MPNTNISIQNHTMYEIFITFNNTVTVYIHNIQIPTPFLTFFSIILKFCFFVKEMHPLNFLDYFGKNEYTI